MVVPGEVPAPGVDDETVRAELASRLLAREGAVGQPQPAASPYGVREDEHRLTLHGGALPRARREVERLLERLDAAAKGVGEDAMDLHERSVD